MHLYSTTGIILFILLQLTEISSTSTREIRLENDITRYIDKWVTSILSIRGYKVPGLMSYTNLDRQRWRIGFQYHRKFIFSEIFFTIQKRMDYYVQGNVLDLERPEIQWNFPENKLRICFEEVPIRISATVASHEDPKFYNGYHCDGYLDNLTVTCHGSDYSDCDIKHTDFYVKNVSERWHNEILTTKEMEPVFQVVIEHLKSTWKLTQFDVSQFQYAFIEPTEEIITIHPDFLSNPQQYYYLIPKIPHFRFTLKRIVIRGLSNFEYYLNKATISLLIRNIHGSMTLDYGFEEESDLELNFQIGGLRLQNFEYGSDSCGYVHAESENYTVTRLKSNVKLGDVESQLIVNGLETGLGSLLLSSVRGIYMDGDYPGRFENTKGSDWKAIKESYKGRIPFNDD